jgi:hypothetical protein
MSEDKGQNVTNQLSLQNMLIESRILMQKIEPDIDNSEELVETFIELKEVEFLLFSLIQALHLSHAQKSALPSYTPLSSSHSSLLTHLETLSTLTRPSLHRTIQKWHTKISLSTPASTQFKSINTSTLQQIEHTLLDKERLLKRTRLDRSNAEAQVYDHEIYNDADFYQVLLNIFLFICLDSLERSD